MIGEGAEGAAYDDMIDARYDAARDDDLLEKRHVQKELQFECCRVQSDDQFTHDDASSPGRIREARWQATLNCRCYRCS